MRESIWLVCLFTRSLGASFGDLLSQPVEYRGLGLGTISTSALFLMAIVGYVTGSGRCEVHTVAE